MADSEWQKVCRDSELPEGTPKLVKAGDEDVLLVRLDGTVRAVGNKCPHYECPLNEGALVGHVLVCRCHDARFDLATGRMLAPPALNDLAVYPVKVEGGDVLVGPVEKARFPKAEGTDARTFITVGAGAAANAAAETLRREGFAGRIVMITAETDPPYDRPNLSKEFMSGKAKPEWMPLRSAKFYSNQKIEVLTGAAVTSLDPRKKTVSLHGGVEMSFDKALLATGGAPRALPIPGADGEGCYNLRSFADARAIMEAAATAKRVVLIGAGFIGMELASSLGERGLAVDVVAPEALPFAQLFGERVAQYLMKRHQEKGVTFHLGATVRQVSGARGAKTVILADATRLEASLVILGTGVLPAVGYLAGTDLVKDGGVPVNERLETAAADIYAAGDIAIVPDAIDGKGTRIEHWVVAERQGQHAARAMLGSTARYDEVPFFWTRQTGISLKHVGSTGAWDALAFRGDVEGGKFVVGYYRKGTLVAAAGVGLPTELTAVELMLRRRIPLPPEALSDVGLDLLARAKR